MFVGYMCGQAMCVQINWWKSKRWIVKLSNLQLTTVLLQMFISDINVFRCD